MSRKVFKVIDSPQRLDSPPARSMRVALVNMPWARAHTPSIQCGLLKSELIQQRHEVEVHYPNLDLAALIGAERYSAISNLESERIHLLGEWLFVPSAFGRQDDEEVYIHTFPEIADMSSSMGGFEELCKLRNETLPDWITAVAEARDWSVYDLVGFTSTFEQNVPALALARKIKETQPKVPIVFGGANFDGQMGREFVRAIPWIDYAVIGEGEQATASLVAALSHGEDPTEVPGVCSVKHGQLRMAPPRPPMKSMDRVPIPDYEDYFSALDRLGRFAVLGSREVSLVAELSRGCWWGEKHHCTFCGLNTLSMEFRAKSSEQALAHLTNLSARYQILRIDAVDNILDMKYLNGLCTELHMAKLDLDIFFEVKANLTRAQIRTLRDAGIRRIQPGLESLSTHVLTLMRKGSSLLLNVRLLKWARYYGVSVVWNMLMGFPGETAEDYRRQIELIPALHHLQPPGGCGRLWLERFSPFFSDPDLGLTQTSPKQAYRFAYPIEGIDYEKIAYFFDYEAKNIAEPGVHAELISTVQSWSGRWEDAQPELTYRRGPGYMQIRDTRGPKPRTTVLAGWRASAYESCSDSAHSVSRVMATLENEGHSVELEQIRAFFESCVVSRISICEDGKYLSLALPSTNATERI